MTRWYRCDIQQVTPSLWRTYLREHGVTVHGPTSKEAMTATVELIKALTGDKSPPIVWLES